MKFGYSFHSWSLLKNKFVNLVHYELNTNNTKWIGKNIRIYFQKVNLNKNINTIEPNGGVKGEGFNHEEGTKNEKGRLMPE